MQNKELCRLRLVQALSVIVFLVLYLGLPAFSQAQTQEIDDGIVWLNANQNSSGSWEESEGTEFRDTAVVLDTLQKLRERGVAYDSALDYLAGVTPANHDQLSRKALVMVRAGLNTTEITDLFAARNPVETDAARPNYPEGGWGPADGYSTNCLDTSLGLDALFAAGLAGGLAVYDETVALDDVQNFQFKLPEGATDLSVVVTSLSGQIKFQLTPGVPPTPYDPSYILTYAPVNLTGLPLVPGTNYIKITGMTASSTYSFEVSYVVDGFDSRSLLTPVNYLKAAQNSDGGWGLSRGSDSSLFLTSQILATLQAFKSYYGLNAEISNGVAWLLGQQNVDSGFGSTGSTVYETAMAYVALAGYDPLSVGARNALAFILTSQLVNGSWNDDPYDTAVALTAIWTSRADIDTDSDGVPDNFDNCQDDPNADQLNTDRDYWGDACDTDDDNDGLSDDFEVNMSGTNPLSADSDFDGITDDLEDHDFDGFNNSEEQSASTHPLRPDIHLAAGLNLFAYPLAVSPGFTAYDLLNDLGSETEISSIERYDPGSGEMEKCYYEGGIAAGDDFAVSNSEGYLVYMIQDKTITFVGDSTCPPVSFVHGFNLAALPCAPLGYTSYDLLQDLGGPGEVAGLQNFNRENGQFETTGYFEGQPAGVNFNVVHGAGYIVHMGVSKELGPFLSSPVVLITSPADGTEFSSSPITVSGTVSNSLATVTVNSIPATVTDNSFTATGVPLSEGQNTITAVAVDNNNLSGSHSITVSLAAADYSINKGGSISDSRRFSGDSAVLDQAAYFTEDQINVPVGFTYSTTGLSRVSATELEVYFTIAVAPTTTEGIYDLQVEYGLLDNNYNPLGPLTDNVFNFRVKVVP